MHYETLSEHCKENCKHCDYKNVWKKDIFQISDEIMFDSIFEDEETTKLADFLNKLLILFLAEEDTFAMRSIVRTLHEVTTIDETENYTKVLYCDALLIEYVKQLISYLKTNQIQEENYE